IAATAQDEINLIACFLVAAEYSVPVKIARVRNVQYSESRAFDSRISGVDYLVNPDQEAAIDIVHIVEQGAASTVTIFENTDVQLREFNVDAENYMIGKTVREIRMGLMESFVITGVARKGELHFPKGDFAIEEEDLVYIVAQRKTFYRLSKIFGIQNDKMRKILIIGGTIIGLRVADMLLSRGRSVVILDKDYERCKYIADILPEALVLNGDISDHQLYSDENVQTMDAIVACTGNEELNILSGLYAKSMGIKRAVALVEKTSYITLAASIGINATVSPKFCAINSISKYIRKGNVRSVHSIFDGNAETIEATLTDNSPLVKLAIKDIQLPPNCLIAAVNRRRKSIIPDGNFALQAGDSVIFFISRVNVTSLDALLS
ncbi:MAG: Trk system potassium transporter TrkA, partial [Deferribacteraceae bacterium]|nr:Trk system potassium transporter TrkA [Deferribacteraceae bacterium]